MITGARQFGTTGSGALYVYNCPMARDGAGADWLQDFESTENPYFGSQMFRCGDKRETLRDASVTPDASPTAPGQHNH
jgi:Cu(I)/Ag(I) efflux system membrane fusion protein